MCVSLAVCMPAGPQIKAYLIGLRTGIQQETAIIQAFPAKLGVKTKPRLILSRASTAHSARHTDLEKTACSQNV